MIGGLLKLHVPVVGVLSYANTSKSSDIALDLMLKRWCLAKDLVAVLKPVEKTMPCWSG